MSYDFDLLKSEYDARWTKLDEAPQAAARLLKSFPRYDTVFKATGVPVILLAAIHDRESGADFSTYLGNGDPLDQVTTHVPAGRGPFATWEAGAVDALQLDGLDKIAQWSIERALYEAELFNGFGYRAYGVPSPYLWSGTPQYTAGKFTSDGHYDPKAVDQQLGVAPIMDAMVTANPELAIPEVSAPIPVTPFPSSGWDMLTIQKFLNTQGAVPQITEDGFYGRETKRAVMAWQTAHSLTSDGVVGPITMAALEAAGTPPVLAAPVT